MLSNFDKIYADLQKGKVTAPRGAKTLELLNYSYTLDPYERFANYPSRKLSLGYIKEEFKWYLLGDPTDLSICDHAAIWKDCVTNDVLHSNYGYYLFAEGGIVYAANCLKADPDSRRAVVPILAQQHLFPANRDVPCTVSLGFRIRDGLLQCTVHMRSQDAVFGLGNDVPFFSLVQEMVAQLVGVPMGELTVFVESLHVYERHWAKLQAFRTEYVEPMAIPKLSSALEVQMLLNHDDSDHAMTHPFTRWLYVTP